MERKRIKNPVISYKRIGFGLEYVLGFLSMINFIFLFFHTHAGLGFGGLEDVAQDGRLAILFLVGAILSSCLSKTSYYKAGIFVVVFICSIVFQFLHILNYGNRIYEIKDFSEFILVSFIYFHSSFILLFFMVINLFLIRFGYQETEKTEAH